MLMTRVRYPNSASLKPVAEARLVLPTPPLPLNNRILIHRLYANSRIVITLVEGLPAGGKPCWGTSCGDSSRSRKYHSKLEDRESRQIYPYYYLLSSCFLAD